MAGAVAPSLRLGAGILLAACRFGLPFAIGQRNGKSPGSEEFQTLSDPGDLCRVAVRLFRKILWSDGWSDRRTMRFGAVESRTRSGLFLCSALRREERVSRMRSALHIGAVESQMRSGILRIQPPYLHLRPCVDGGCAIGRCRSPDEACSVRRVRCGVCSIARIARQCRNPTWPQA